MSSFLSTPLIEAENALAADATFLAWCGAIDAADAKANYIFSDDSKIESELPAKYAALSEMDGWSFTRIADGAGRGSFHFNNGQFSLVFVEEVGLTVESYTATNRIAFKDTVAGFITDFLNNFEGTGQRVTSLSQIPFSDQFPMRGEVENGGKYIYQYGISVVTGLF